MTKKKKVLSSSTSPSIINSSVSDYSAAVSNSNLVDLKSKISDDNLSTPVDNEVGPIDGPSFERTRKRSLVSLPGGEESEGEDEFLFIRLRKQFKRHWNKIIEQYPNGSSLFRSPLSHNNDSELARTASVQTSSTTSSLASSVAKEQSLLSSAIKSSFLLPAFSCKMDDEGRRSVPFISSLLQVNGD